MRWFQARPAGPLRMGNTAAYPLLADLVLAAHFAIVVFVVCGLLFIVAGNIRDWPWVNALWFRLLHLIAIAVVVVETWLGLACPLTTLESWLRAETGASADGGSFIGYWLGRALYFDAPAWVFTVGYSIFGLLVAAAWWYFPPNVKHADRSHNAQA